ncbi:MAG: hypothetical protein N4A45_04225 [Flavobacteriales bacterium]|jgi:hypothetical protein|nr:hypothetical protein [Flavobacteriales bacterium]
MKKTQTAFSLTYYSVAVAIGVFLFNTDHIYDYKNMISVFLVCGGVYLVLLEKKKNSDKKSD